MKIILSPAKKMRVDADAVAAATAPVYVRQAEEILVWLRQQTGEALQALWKCNDKIAEQNLQRIASMDLNSGLTPAVLAYDGIAYQYMAPAVFEYGHYDYVQEHLRILSAFYGVLRPMDGVTPYRLEMQAKASVGEHKDLYAFWGKKIYDAVRDDSGVIINLASKEYSKCVEKYLQPDDCYITCSFVEPAGGKLVTKGTYAKMARGEMVRYMAENNVEAPEEIKGFNHLGYVFREDLSSDTEYVFERQPDAQD